MNSEGDRKRYWSLVASGILHAAGLLAAFSISITPPREPKAERLNRVLTYLAPPPAQPVYRRPELPRHRFITPPRPQRLPNHLALPELPTNLTAPTVPPTTLPVLNAPPPPRPAVQTGLFAETRLREETPRQVKPQIEAGGFTTAETASAPGGNRRALATGGFDARPHPETAPAERKLSNKRAFGDATVESPARRPNQPIGEARFEPVEILFKPRPLYTTEARKRQIEGEVLLETVFSASGDVRVLRVLSGLGYGLDESAITAARAMRFRPARREGVAVDAIATVHIVFQLAY